MQLSLIHGNHSFARTKIKAQVIKQFAQICGVGNETSYFLGFDSSGTQKTVLEKIKQKLTNESLFALKELVVINISLGEKTGRLAKNTVRENFLRLVKDSVASLLPKMSSNIFLVLDVSTKLPKSSGLLKIVEKIGGTVHLAELPKAKDKTAILNEIKKFLTGEKINLDRYLIQKIVEDSGGDWWYVFSALEQAVLYSRAYTEKYGKESVIAEEALRELFGVQEDQSVFKVFDAIGEGDKAKAFSLLYENNNLRWSKPSPTSVAGSSEVEKALGFISLMARQLRQMIALKDDISPQQAQKDWGVPVFAFFKLKNQTAYFSRDFLNQAFMKLVELQEKAKRGLYSPLSLLDFYVFYLISHRNVARK